MSYDDEAQYEGDLNSAEIRDIEGLVKKATERKPLRLDVEGGPRKLRVFNPNGYTDHDIRNERGHQIENIADLCDLALRVGTKATVWHDEKEIKVCFDDDARFDAATMKLKKDDRFAAIEGLGSDFSHEAFVDFLRVKMDGAIEPKLVELFEKISTKTDAASEAQLARQSVSQTAKAMAGVDQDVPSEIVFKTPVYCEAQIEEQPVASIRCIVRIAVAAGKFRLTPVKRDLEMAMMHAGRHINGTLKGELSDTGTEKLRSNIVGIYQGRP